MEILDECLAEDAAPAFGGGRLLRSLAQVFEELGNSAKRQHRVVTPAVAGGHSWLPLRDGCGLFCPEGGEGIDRVPQRTSNGLRIRVGAALPEPTTDRAVMRAYRVNPLSIFPARAYEEDRVVRPFFGRPSILTSPPKIFAMSCSTTPTTTDAPAPACVFSDR